MADELNPNVAWQGFSRGEIGPHRESYVAVPVDDGDTVVIDPSFSSNWFITAAGDLTIRVSVDVDNEAVGVAPQPFLYGLKLWVVRPIGAVTTFLDAQWSQDAQDPNGDGSLSDSLVRSPAEKGGSDVYTLTVFPGRGIWVFFAGRGFSDPDAPPDTGQGDGSGET